MMQPGISMEKSPFTPEQWAEMKRQLTASQERLKTIDRFEKSGAYTPEQIKDLRDSVNQTIAKINGIFKAFGDLHPGQ